MAIPPVFLPGKSSFRGGFAELDMTEHTCKVTTLGLLVHSTMDFRIHMFKAGLNKYIYLNMLCRCLFLSKPTLHNIVVQM